MKTVKGWQTRYPDDFKNGMKSTYPDIMFYMFVLYVS